MSQTQLRLQKDCAEWSRRVVLALGLAGTSWVMHPGKGSQCGKLCVHIPGVTPSYGQRAPATEETLPLLPLSLKCASMDSWNLDSKLSHLMGTR